MMQLPREAEGSVPPLQRIRRRHRLTPSIRPTGKQAPPPPLPTSTARVYGHGLPQRQQQERRGPASAWPDLPPELLERIVAVLGPRDRVAVRLVCASWRACVREWFPSDLPFEAPRLLLRRRGTGGGLAFFSFHRRKVLPFALPATLGAAAATPAFCQSVHLGSDQNRCQLQLLVELCVCCLV